jgi:hypothetical protein
MSRILFYSQRTADDIGSSMRIAGGKLLHTTAIYNYVPEYGMDPQKYGYLWEDTCVLGVYENVELIKQYAATSAYMRAWMKKINLFFRHLKDFLCV